MSGLNDYTSAVVAITPATRLLTAPSTAELLISGGFSTGLSGGVDVGFDFALAGKEYSRFVVSPSGWLLLSGPSPSRVDDFRISSTPWTTSGRVLVFPWWDNLITFGGVKTWLAYIGGKGVSGKCRVIEWDVLSDSAQTATTNGFCGDGDDYENLKFQALLYYDTSKIEFRYGAETIVGTPAISNWGASCGVRLEGASESDGDYRDFFGASGSPLGSVSPFTTNLTTATAVSQLSGSINYPGNSSNTYGYAHNIVFTSNSVGDTSYVLPSSDYFLTTKLLKIKIVSDDEAALGPTREDPRPDDPQYLC